MYMTLMPVGKMIMSARFVGSFILLFNISGILAAFLICRPYAKNYYTTMAGSCGSTKVFYIWISALNLLTDLIILLLPLPFVYKLQLPLRKRLGLAGMFSVGLL